MNNQSPLIPQGSFLEQKNKGRARVKIAVFVVLAIHGIGLLALLMQGCKKEPEPMPIAGEEETNTALPPAPAIAEETNTPAPFVAPVAVVTNNFVPPAVEPSTPPPVVAPSPAPAATEYKVARGDTYATIAPKFHITTRALMDANPGIEPTKLQIGQTLHIPPPSESTAPATVAGPAPTPETGTGEPIYSVKSGDTLSRIASQYKVSVRAIMSANNLTTTRIRVGQKLKIPVKVSAPPSVPTSPTGGSGVPTQ